MPRSLEGERVRSSEARGELEALSALLICRKRLRAMTAAGETLRRVIRRSAELIEAKEYDRALTLLREKGRQPSTRRKCDTGSSPDRCNSTA